MISPLEDLKLYFQNNRKRLLKEYFDFLSFPSISSEPEYKNNVLECAQWVTHYLKTIHFDVENWPTNGHPVIFAKSHNFNPELPTLLIYNHYDVQPIDPLELWNTEPFNPTVIDGEVFARGAQDNKGQCFYVMAALKALLELYGKFPINIKLCIEGEEECGSFGLAQILKEKTSELKSDYLAIVDLGLRNKHRPAITLGIRGLVTMDLELQSSDHDLHSGSHGGIAINPIHALVTLLSKLRNEEGKIRIPGFYDDLAPQQDEEQEVIAWDFDIARYKKDFGAEPLGGEISFSPLQRNWVRPTLEINGISGGYAGSGFKTVIPAKAHAKLSCRLVPDQDPQKIGQLVAKFLKSQIQPGVQIKVEVHEGGGKAVRTQKESKLVQAFSNAYQEIFEAGCEYIYEGASIPIVTKLSEACGAEVILVGLGLPTDCIHAPNEHFGLDRLEKGFLSIARALQNLGLQGNTNKI